MITALPSQQDIAERAYFRFQARGAVDGFHLEDWLQAERELLEERATEEPAASAGPEGQEEEDEEGAPVRRVRPRKSYPRTAAG